ncbi:MAG: anti-sigma factor [Chloroflexota bacterium]
MNGHEDRVAAYVLDALEPEERLEFERHLRGCTTCQAEVATLAEVAETLALAVDEVEPPAELGLRIGAAARVLKRRERRAFSPVYALLAAAAAAIIALGVWNYNLQTSRPGVAVTGYQQAVLRAVRHQAAVVPIGPVNGSAKASLVQPAGKHAYLLVDGLAAVPAGKVYQLWLIKNNKPYSAAVFRYRGRGLTSVPANRASAGYSIAAVTIEPAPGSPAPTGPKVLLGKLQA